MSILKLRDENGTVVEIAALRGKKGEPGEVTTAAANAAFANALKGSRSGEITAADDVSPAEHELSLTVKSKNLLDIHSAIPINSLETVVVENDTIILKDFSTHHYGIGWTDIPFVVGETYTFSVSSDLNAISSSWGWRVAYADGTHGVLSNPTQTVTILKEVSRVNFYVTFGDMTETQDIRIEKPMIERGTSVTGYTPYIGDLTSVTVSRWGKNLLDIHSALPIGTLETVVVENDTIILKDFSTNHYGIGWENIPFVVGETYTFSVGSDLNAISSSWGWRIAYADGTHSVVSNPTKTETILKEVKRVNFYAAFGNITETQDIRIEKPMVELGTAVTDYEPYKTVETGTPNADGKVEGLTSVYPTTTLMTDTPGAVAQWEYNRDTNKIIADLMRRLDALEAAAISNV